MPKKHEAYHCACAEFRMPLLLGCLPMSSFDKNQPRKRTKRKDEGNGKEDDDDDDDKDDDGYSESARQADHHIF